MKFFHAVEGSHNENISLTIDDVNRCGIHAVFYIQHFQFLKATIEIYIYIILYSFHFHTLTHFYSNALTYFFLIHTTVISHSFIYYIFLRSEIKRTENISTFCQQPARYYYIGTHIFLYYTSFRHFASVARGNRAHEERNHSCVKC